MSVQIWLDVPALERLIGGDTEVEVRMRQVVVEEFAKRHLVKVVKEEGFAKFLAQEARVAQVGLEAMVKAKVGEVVNVSQDWRTVYAANLTPEVKQALEVQAGQIVSEIVRRTVDDVWALREARIVNEVSAAIQQRTTALTERLVSELVRARLDAVAKAVAK